MQCAEEMYLEPGVMKVLPLDRIPHAKMQLLSQWNITHRGNKRRLHRYLQYYHAAQENDSEKHKWWTYEKYQKQTILKVVQAMPLTSPLPPSSTTIVKGAPLHPWSPFSLYANVARSPSPPRCQLMDEKTATPPPLPEFNLTPAVVSDSVASPATPTPFPSRPRRLAR